MLDYGTYVDIAYSVYNSLGIPEDQYLQFKSDKEAREFSNSYSEEEIANLVNAEMANYDTSDNYHPDIEDMKKNAVEEVMRMIYENEEQYYDYKRGVIEHTYAGIVELLSNSNIPEIDSVDTEYEPADPSVGIYGEERAISIKLTTGQYIYFDVEFDD